MLRTLALASLFTLAASPALACTISPCRQPVRVFAEGQDIPGNLAYFKILREGATLTLETGEGTPIPTSVRTIGRDRVFAPDAPIPPHTIVRLKWEYTCTDEPLWRESGEYLFTTRAHAELRVVTPTLARVASGRITRTEEEFGFVQVALGAGDDVAHLYETRFVVDGDPSKTAAQQHGDATLFSPCNRAARGQNTCGYYDEYPLGVHTITTDVHIIGANSDPEPASITVSTTCDIPPPEVGGPDASVSSGDAGTRTDGGSRGVDAGRPIDAGARGGDDDSLEEEVSRKDEGCRLAHGCFDGAWLALGLAMLLRRNRR